MALTFATAGALVAIDQEWRTFVEPAWQFIGVFTWLLAAVAVSVFAVVRHAENLAVRLGEPLGTLILTLAITGIEVMIIVAAMSTGHGSPTLARDAMLSVIMIVLNGMIGLTLLVGGLKYHEQEYNLQGAHAFLAVILPLSVLGLVVPNYTGVSPDQTFPPVQAGFITLIFVSLYAVFLTIQNIRHRAYFQSAERTVVSSKAVVHPLKTWHHAALLTAHIVPLVVLSEMLASPLETLIKMAHAPATLAGFLIASLILAPESVAAIRAALVNDLQRSVNVLLGSVLASTGLTIPAVLLYGLMAGRPIILGVDQVDVALLALTLVLSAMTFSGSHTNILLGAVHIVMFLAYVILMFQR